MRWASLEAGVTAPAIVFIGPDSDRHLLLAQGRAIKAGANVRSFEYPFQDRAGPDWGKLLYNAMIIASWMLSNGIEENDLLIVTAPEHKGFAKQFILAVEGEIRCQRQFDHSKHPKPDTIKECKPGPKPRPIRRLGG